MWKATDQRYLDGLSSEEIKRISNIPIFLIGTTRQTEFLSNASDFKRLSRTFEAAG
jgi:hypothetical protein